MEIESSMLSPDQWKERGSFTSYKAHSIFYIRQGEGDALLLLHGFPTSSWDWYKIWTELTKEVEAIAFDFIGFGFSDKPRYYGYSIMDQADLTEALMDYLQVTRLHLLVHDYGVSVAQELLARQNDNNLSFQIQSCTFLNGGLFPGVHKPRFIQKLLMTPLGPVISAFYQKRNLQKTFIGIFGPETPPAEEEINNFWYLMNYNQGKKIVHKIIRYMKERKDHEKRWLQALKSATCPLRLINGAADPISGLHLAEHYQKAVPNPDCVIIDRIGHYPQIEAPGKVTRELLGFIGSIG